MTRQTIEQAAADRKSKPAKTVKRTGGKDKAGPQKTSRRQQLHKMLYRKSGVTIAQLQTAFGWQPHTARAAISTLRKAGHGIERSKAAPGSIYRIVRED